MKLRFPLPIDDCPARLALRSNGALNAKDYVLKVVFPGLDLPKEEASELNLSYSDSFKSAFIYNAEQSKGEAGNTSYFRIPEGATSLEVAVERWQKSAEVATVETIRLNLVAPWEKYNHLTITGVEVDG